MDERLEELLRPDPHIVLVEQAEQWNVPEVDIARLVDDSTGPEFNNGFMRTLTQYLDLPYIIDDFQNPRERRAWEEAFLDAYYPKEHLGTLCDDSENDDLTQRDIIRGQLRETALRQNMITRLIGQIGELNSSYQGPNQERLYTLCGTFLKNVEYCSVVARDVERGLVKKCDLLEPMEKYAWAKQMKQQVYDILVFLGEQTAVQKGYATPSS